MPQESKRPFGTERGMISVGSFPFSPALFYSALLLRLNSDLCNHQTENSVTSLYVRWYYFEYGAAICVCT